VACSRSGNGLIYCIGFLVALRDRNTELADSVAEECAAGEGRLTAHGCAFAEGQTRVQVAFCPGCRDPPLLDSEAHNKVGRFKKRKCAPFASCWLALSLNSCAGLRKERKASAGRTSCATSACAFTCRRARTRGWG
jgi:hypothetical protein